MFRAAAIALPITGLVVIEVGLRWLGAGDDLRLIVRVDSDPPVLNHRFNAKADRPYYGAVDLSGPEPRRFDLPKPAGTYRIVVVGASTVIGFPFAAELAFPRQLEIRLQRQLPDLQVEVLNAGITSINSLAVKDIARQALSCDPDLIIVHTGHNEFYGPGGVGSSALQLPPALLSRSFAVRRFRLTQLVEHVVPFSEDSDKDLIETLPRALAIPHDGKLFEEAVRQYSHNLQDIAHLSSEAGVPVALTSVASNLRDQSPIGRMVFPGETDEVKQEWSRLRGHVDQLVGAAQWESALEAIDQFEEAFRADAVTTYRKGQCLEALERFDEAADAFALARDLDPCRFRAPGAFQDVVAEVAARTQVHFFDIAAEIEDVAAPRTPGHELFLEHVHYNLHGHRVVGDILARHVCERVLGRPWDSVAPVDQPLGDTRFDELAGFSLALNTIQTPPLRDAADAEHHQAYLIERIEQLYQTLDPVEQSAFAEMTMRTMQTDLLRGLQSRFEAAGRLDAALRIVRNGVERQPWSPERHIALARLQIQFEEFSAARATLEQAQLLDPESSAADVLRRRLELVRAAEQTQSGLPVSR